jgi:putative ABC transport system substrate-binding protein
MHRRDFVTGLMIASAMRPAVAQQPAKTKRIALVATVTKVSDITDKNRDFRVLFEELNRLGFIEGQNLVVERYSAEGQRERHVELAREVVGTHPDVIVVFSGVLALAFKAATKEIPIVANTVSSCQTCPDFFPCITTELGKSPIKRGGPSRSEARGRCPNPRPVGIDLQ